MKRQRIVAFFGLVVTLACLALLVVTFWIDASDLGPGWTYFGEVWAKEGTKLEVRGGALHQEGDGGLTMRHSRVGSIRAVLGVVLALSSAAGWLLLLRRQRPERSAGDATARSAASVSGVPQ
jgi:hypothetical protein